MDNVDARLLAEVLISLTNLTESIRILTGTVLGAMPEPAPEPVPEPVPEPAPEPVPEPAPEPVCEVDTPPWESAPEDIAPHGGIPSAKTKEVINTVTLEQVRGLMAAKVQQGHRQAVRASLDSHGLDKLSSAPPELLPALFADVEGIG